MQRKYVAVLLLLGLSGCAQTVWIKPGAAQADLNRDSYACEKDTRQSGPFGPGLIGIMGRKDFYGKCMVAHGWIARTWTARN